MRGSFLEAIYFFCAVECSVIINVYCFLYSIFLKDCCRNRKMYSC